MTCAIERSEDGYRLLVEHDGEIQLHENHCEMATAAGKAEMLRDDFIAKGWSDER